MKHITAWIERILKIPSIHFVYDVFQRFGNDNGALYAAGLAFFLVLSFAPIILTGIAVIACFVNVHVATVHVTELIQNLMPSGGARTEATRFLTERIDLNKQAYLVVDHRGVAGLLGFLSLVWTTLQIFINSTVAMNAMFEVKESRSWLVVRGMALALMLITGALIVMSLLMTGAPSAIVAYRLPLGERLPVPMWCLTAIFELLAVITNALMYTMIYKLLPSTKVSWRAAMIGGVTASVLFEAAKKGVAVYLLKANHTVYGDLANLILFILWIYYSMTIFLLGAEVTAAVARLSGDTHKQSYNIRMRSTHFPNKRKMPNFSG